MSCWGGPELDYSKERKPCPDCGEETIDGQATNSCSYSTVECKTCGYAPCDRSC